MTRADIIRMAQEAGFDPHDMSDDFSCNLVEIERFVALVAAAEREACAEILLDYAGRDDLSDSDQSLLKHLFELIRARGEK